MGGKTSAMTVFQFPPAQTTSFNRTYCTSEGGMNATPESPISMRIKLQFFVAIPPVGGQTLQLNALFAFFECNELQAGQPASPIPTYTTLNKTLTAANFSGFGAPGIYCTEFQIPSAQVKEGAWLSVILQRPNTDTYPQSFNLIEDLRVSSFQG